MTSYVPRRSLICGISGQDGAYLAQLLLSKGHEVWGTSRNAQMNTFSGLKQLGIYDKVRLRSMKPDDYNSVIQVVEDVKPHEIFNLSGQSSVGLSFEKPLETVDSIYKSTLNLLEAIRIIDKSIRFFNAGSSEVFGDTGEKSAGEDNMLQPQSPYAVAKAASTWQVASYRKSYSLFACTGILFNHESPLRSERFVTTKVIAAVRRIASGSCEKLELGNTTIRRDWGWAPEYVYAMWKMLNQDAPEDFVIATGSSHSLQEFVEAVFLEADLDWRDHVTSIPGLLRPSDPLVSTGNSTKAKALLNWCPSIAGLDVARKLYKEHVKHNVISKA
jgi:GDPmannose 4,6-dehydratase